MKDAFKNACEGLALKNQWGGGGEGAAEREEVTTMPSLQREKWDRLNILK